jgi:uncharacterized protein (DUF983 family)
MRTTFLWRCPACGNGKLFARAFTLQATCPACGVRFERDRGEWTGPVVISYGIGSGLSLLTWLILFGTGNLFPYAEALIGVMAVGVGLGSHRFAKAFWIWLIHAAGLVYADRSPSP